VKIKNQTLNIKNISIWFVVFCLFIVKPILSQPSPIFQAMQDEMKRTTEKLKLQKEKPPYYVSYKIVDEKNISIQSELGAIVSNHTDHNRYLVVDLRVGKYDFDNTNFLESSEYSYSFGQPGGSENLPLDDDYDAIRQKIWLVTDEQYKAAIDLLAKKKSAIEHKQIKDTIADFSRVSPDYYIESAKNISLDRNEWLTNIKTISNIFRAYPKIQTSGANFSFQLATIYFLDSDGNKYVKNDINTNLEVSANTQTTDGISLTDNVTFSGHIPLDLPVLSAIIQKVNAMADTLVLLTAASEEKDYTGPVMFTSLASPELFFEIIGKGLSDARKPIYEDDEMAQMMPEQTGFLADKINKEVLPKSFSVSDDPTLRSYNGISLYGNYGVDDQGVKPEKLNLIKIGKLLTIPMSRTPIKEIKKSNGHGRFIGGQIRNAISNLVVTSDQTKDSLETEFINLLKQKELDYGIVITQLAFQIPKGRDEMMAMFFGGSRPEAPLISEPLIAYRLYQNGKKELIRGLKFDAVTPMILKDIVAAGNNQIVDNFIYKEQFTGSYLPLSVVAPSVIIEKMIMTSNEAKAKKLPYLTHPYFGKK
jgi:predicted Zn-dependent protease